MGRRLRCSWGDRAREPVGLAACHRQCRALKPGETHLCRWPPAGSAGWLAGRLRQQGAPAAAPGTGGGGRFRATVSNRAVQLPKQNHSVRKPKVAKNSRRVPA